MEPEERDKCKQKVIIIKNLNGKRELTASHHKNAPPHKSLECAPSAKSLAATRAVGEKIPFIYRSTPHVTQPAKQRILPSATWQSRRD